jgi:hypothetical protein
LKILLERNLEILLRTSMTAAARKDSNILSGNVAIPLLFRLVS